MPALVLPKQEQAMEHSAPVPEFGQLMQTMNSDLLTSVLEPVPQLPEQRPMPGLWESGLA